MGLEIDEAFSLQLASLTPNEIIRGTAADQHPPLHYLLLHFWMGMVGDSVLMIRLLSALAGFATVCLVCRAGLRFGPLAALTAAGLLAISPAHVWYSQQARMYSLLVFLGTMSTWLAWRWWSEEAARTWPRPLLYAGITLATLYTHYFALFLIAAQNLAGLLVYWPQSTKSRWQLAGRWLGTQMIVLVGFLPWLPTMIDQTLHHRLDWIPPLSWPIVRHSWLYLLNGGDWQGTPIDYLVILLGAALVLLALWPGDLQHRSQKLGRAWAGLWFAGPVLLIIGLASLTPIYQDKQLLIALPPLVLLLALGILRLTQPMWRSALLVSFLGISILSLGKQYSQPGPQHWDEVAAYLNEHAQPGDLLYMNAAASELVLDIYLDVEMDKASYPPAFSLLQGGWTGEIATQEVVRAQLGPLSEKHPRIWLVEFSPGFWDPQGLILNWLNHHYRQVDTLQSRGIRLLLFVREE
jgi:uncharacterized membrane protein